MNIDFKPLVITPQPIYFESLMGLILRTSEANGYSSPNYILKYIGLDEREIRSIRPPLNKIAPLYGKSPAELAKFYPDPAINKKTKKWCIANHSIPALYVNIKNTCVCPECIIENGFIDSLWEIRFVSVCAKHQRELVEACPACKKPLRWQRKGLLTCSCGQDLSSVRGEKVNDRELLSIIELIQWKLRNHELDEQDLIKFGYPLSDLRKVSLSTLLGIIERLQTKRKRITKFAEPLGNGNKLNVLKLASGMLAQWPNGFYDLLKTLPTENRHSASKNLQQQYRSIYNSFFKSGLPIDEMKFIMKAFALLSDELGGNAYIDARLAKKAEIDRRFVGVHGLAQHLKIRLPTILKYVKKGILKPQMRKSMGQTIMMFDLHNLPFKASEGKYLKQREAAQYIRLSPRMLRTLKKNEVYKIRRLGWGVDGYSELDLIEFRDGFINKAPKEFETVSDYQIQLSELFRKKLHIENAINILGAILKGSLIPTGRTGNEIPDIVLSKFELTNYIKKNNTRKQKP